MNISDPQHVDAVVIGGGMAGLVAAWQFTQEGLHPVLVESRGYTGGLIARSTLAGISYDIGAEGWAVRLPDTAELATELGLTVEKPTIAPSWVYFDDACFAMPDNAILGIPANLSDPAVIIALGAEEAARAAELDRAPMPEDLPRDLGTLVASRMGSEVLRRLVTPIAGGIHAADPHLLSVDVVSPGLRAATQATGSLAAGVALCRSRMPAGPAVASVAGGMFIMPAELRRQAEQAGATTMTRVGARGLTRHGDQWLVETAGTSRNPDPSLPPVTDGEIRSFLTPRVVVACSAGPATKLLSNVIDTVGPELAPGAPIGHVNLALQAPALDSSPRGNGMLVAPGTTTVTAKALTHMSAKWPSLRESCPEGLHLLRVSYGRSGEANVALSVDQALTDASVLLGVDLSAEQVVDSQIIHWTGSLAPTTPQARAWRDGLHRQLEVFNQSGQGRIGLVGSWASGSGIAALVPQARRTVRQLV
ncbi:protoporphyrinogen/coproporphyrinogen oxidase [Cutibacterium acnes]|uniref:protoporphyrinogen/coproporphyrinogen oxidase n=1 Tax=Cutibacterium acnes TaxID=1747 RepID=UPI000206320A|nr:FAD-dependent oxidoreductase [Cutibacterium acnes]EGF70323.1 putative protoporphyrinogen oxidase [Cutibacterium acnes HL025PA2]